MKSTLLRINSTGRTGSNFLAHYFKFLGYESYHENFRKFLPIDSEAYNFFQAELMEMWNIDPVDFHKIDFSFPSQYLKAFQRRMLYQNLLPRKGGLLVDSDNTTTPSTLFLAEEMQKHGITFKCLTLFRNPFKTIHAIYLVERKGGYLYRARSIFSSPNNIIRAAEIWRSTYQMCLDFEKVYPINFFRINIEEFGDIELVRSMHEFVGVNLDTNKYNRFVQLSNKNGLRKSKSPSIKNSDLFHDPGFVFNSEELDKIEEIVYSAASSLGLDVGSEREKYVDFHDDRLRHVSDKI